MTAASVTCPNGHSNPERQHFCGECGAALPVSCPNGHRNPPHHHFCGKCGAALGESSRTPDTPRSMSARDPEIAASETAPPENIPAPDISGTSKPGQPAVSKDPSGQRKVWFAIGILLVVLAGVAVNRIGIPFWDHYLYPRFFEKGSSTSSPGPSPSARSPSYQAGYDSGTSGLARNTYGEEFDTSDVAKSEQYACSTAFTGQHILDASLTEDDYVKGCLKAFSDHPPAKR